MRQICDLVTYAEVASTLLSAEQTAADEDFSNVLRHYQQRLYTIASNSCEWTSGSGGRKQLSKPACSHIFVLQVDVESTQSATPY